MVESARIPEQELGRRVRAKRQEIGLTLEQLAARSGGMRWSYLGTLERTGKNVTLRNLLRIAKGLEVDPADLVRGLEFDD